MKQKVAPDMLALQRLYHWEKTAPDRIALTQPMGGGVVKDYTWAQVADQVRRMAAHLKSQGWEPGAKVAILSKNCAWWLMSDLAIWMAGYVSVPLYPTLAHDTVRQILTHSEAKACFVGKLDGWEGMKPGVPAGLPCISYPLSPPDAIKSYEGGTRSARAPTAAGHAGAPRRRPGDAHLHVGHHRPAQGRDARLRQLRLGAGLRPQAHFDVGEDRMLSYLPLAHVVERVLVEHGWLRTGMQVYFAETLDTFTADVQRARPTVFFSVPRLWVKFQHGVHHKMPAAKLDRLLSIPIIGGLVRRKILKALGLDQCKFAAGGAAPMPVALLAWYRKLGLPVNEGYGMTENLAPSHLTLPGRNQEGTVGPPYDGVEARIDAQTGEIQMRSRHDARLLQGAGTDARGLHRRRLAAHRRQGADRRRRQAEDHRPREGPVQDQQGQVCGAGADRGQAGHARRGGSLCVTGANMGQPLGIVMLNAEAMARVGDPATRAEIETSLAEHLTGINATLDPHEQLQCIVVARPTWTVDNDLITPTFKVKRNRIEDLYAANYERWEASGKKVVWQTA